MPGTEKENMFPVWWLKHILIFLRGRVVAPSAPTAEKPARLFLTALAPRKPYKALALADRNEGPMGELTI